MRINYDVKCAHMHLARKLRELLKNASKSLLLLGPRQTGKSTLIRSLNPDLEINLSDEETFVRFLRDPGLLRKSIQNHRTIFIDEIQRIPSLLNTVQAVLDHDNTLRFFLTGSSARKLKKGKANLLPGRVFSYELGPLTLHELGDSFQLDKALRHGLLPGPYLDSNPATAQKLLRTYSLTYLKEEVQAEALTRNLEGFSRFFQIIASRNGDFIDFAKYSSQAMIEITSARRYFEILQDTLVLQVVPPFAKSHKRRLIQHPRYYFFDTGALNGALENFEPSGDRMGGLFENLTLQLISSTAKSLDIPLQVSVYRTEAGAEVDFIVQRSGPHQQTFAIEVKATRTIGGHDFSGLKSFSNFYKQPHTPMIIYLGDTSLAKDGIPILPIKEALNLIFS